MPSPVALRSKKLDCFLWLDGIAVWIPAWDRYLSILSVVSVQAANVASDRSIVQRDPTEYHVFE